MRPYSVDLRVRVVLKHRVLHLTYDEVSADMAVSTRTVRRYVARFNNDHALLPRRDRTRGRPRRFSPAAMQVRQRVARLS